MAEIKEAPLSESNLTETIKQTSKTSRATQPQPKTLQSELKPLKIPTKNPLLILTIPILITTIVLTSGYYVYKNYLKTNKTEIINIEQRENMTNIKIPPKETTTPEESETTKVTR